MPLKYLRILAAVLCLVLTPMAQAGIDHVDIGWSGNYRAGHWTPIFVTLSDDSGAQARNVVVEIVTPQGSLFALNIRNQLTIYPQPNTYLLYAPLSYRLDETSVVMRDARSGRILAERGFDRPANTASGDDPFAAMSFPTSQHGNEMLIGVAGRPNGLRILQRTGTFREETQSEFKQPIIEGTTAKRSWDQFEYFGVQVGFLDGKLLPDRPIGYDGLHLLVLSAPDMIAMSARQQQAIAAWVKAGGHLLFWPGDSLIPPDSPIVSLLPCTIGLNDTLPLSLADTKRLGIAPRFEKLPSRKLQPRPGATKFELPSGLFSGYSSRAGLGFVAMLPVDASQVVFNDEKSAQKFWWPILANVINVNNATPANRNYWQPDAQEVRRAGALSAVVDRLGDVPGVGKFDFGYITIVMLAMMVIVGPVDWFVLKKLGRQPWTWVTTSGWIALVTFAAIYAGHIFKSGELHYRTVRLIDQVDDEVVAVKDVAGIYSPRTQTYGLAGPHDAWWQPANPEAEQYAPWRRTQSRGLTDVFLVQDSRGTLPAPALVNVWNLRFMENELGEPGSIAPALKAKLERKGTFAALNERIVGTITNVSSAPIRNPRLRMMNRISPVKSRQNDGNNSIVLEMIKPGETVPIDMPGYFSWVEGTFEVDDISHRVTSTSSPRFSSVTFTDAVCELSTDRADRIKELLQDTKVACIYAEFEDVAPSVTLEHKNGTPAKEKHWQIVRAVVPVK